jgi:hypothetical protein
VPAKESKVAGVRYYDVTEEAGIDEKQFVTWVKQAVLLPGEKM